MISSSPPEIPELRRHRWKRWFVLGMGLSMLATGTYLISGNGEIRRAERVQIGHTLAEVEAVMGPPTWGYIRPGSTFEMTFYGQSQAMRLELAHWIYRLTGKTTYRNRAEDWPIQFH